MNYGTIITTFREYLRHKILSTFWCQQVRYYLYLETLTLFVSPRTAVSLGSSRAYKRVRVSGPTLGIIFWVRVRVRVYNGL